MVGRPGRAFTGAACRKAAFLAAYRLCGNIYRAAQEARIARCTIYEWRAHDHEFDLACREAEVEAVERLEEEARRRAYDGVTREHGIYYRGQKVATEIITEYSDSLLMFLLKALRPEKYKERLTVESVGEADSLTPEEREAIRQLLTSSGD